MSVGARPEPGRGHDQGQVQGHVQGQVQGRGHDRSARGYLSIGDVLSRLRPQFPDVTISKIRFLEAEGLVEPERTPGGYRKFSPEDVDRLRFVLESQRDRYLPLRVIREQLAAMDGGELRRVDPQDDGSGGSVQPAKRRAGDPGAGEAPGPAAGPDGGSQVADVRMTRRELAVAAGLAPEQLTELERYGIVVPRAGSYYDGDALVVAKAVGELARFGVEPRHLRAVKTAADREVGLIEQVVSPYARAGTRRGPESRDRGAAVAGELAALLARLHTGLVRAGLSPDLRR